MRPIVAALLLLCSADTVAQAAPPHQLAHAPLVHAQVERAQAEADFDRHALRWLPWRD